MEGTDGAANRHKNIVTLICVLPINHVSHRYSPLNGLSEKPLGHWKESERGLLKNRVRCFCIRIEVQ